MYRSSSIILVTLLYRTPVSPTLATLPLYQGLDSHSVRQGTASGACFVRASARLIGNYRRELVPRFDYLNR